MKSRIPALILALAMLLSLLPVKVLATEPRPAADSVPDADYDGIPDSIDPDPSRNSFSGTYRSGDFTVPLSYTVDYRNFFGDNTVYNQDIADFSTWAAQLCYENEDGSVTYTPAESLPTAGGAVTKVTHVDQLMSVHGMEDVIDYKLEQGYVSDNLSLEVYSDDDITEVYFGHHKVSFNGENIEVIAIYVRGTNGTEKEWCSNFDVGDLNRFDNEFDCVEGKMPRQRNEDWSRKSNHRGFDVCSTRVRRALDAYLEAFVDGSAEPVFWLTGHSRGGAICNITASYLVDVGHKVFAYTFATPNTTANTEASAARYDCIFNLINGDDFAPRLPMPEWGFTRYGRTAVKYASTAENSQRSAYLGSTAYSYASDASLRELVDKFAGMTKNNVGVIEGWRDVYVYHCHSSDTVGSYHTHEGETVGEYRSGTRKSFFTNNNWNNYNEHTKKYSYCIKDNNGLINKWSCCQTPAYAMQLLAITMGNLGLSAGWEFLTSYDLADKFDFGKMSLITNYATKIIDPHYMENYYLIQKLSELQGNPNDIYTTGSSLYTDENHRPLHTHSYILQPDPDYVPTCTEPGRGKMVCTCSQINPGWYDDVIKDVIIPALGHQPGEPVEENRVEPTATEPGGYDTVVYCQRCGQELSRVHTEIPVLGPQEPIPDPSLRLFYSVSTQIEIRTQYSVLQNDVQSFDSWYVEISKLDADGNPTETKRFGEGQEGAVEAASAYAWSIGYTDITAKDMGVPYRATLHAFEANGQEHYSESVTKTIREVLLEVMQDDNSSRQRRTLAADMLNYGAAAQVYFDFDTGNLVNENLSAAEQEALDHYASTGEAPANLNNTSSMNVFCSTSIRNRIILHVALLGPTEENVKVRLKELDGNAEFLVDAEKQGQEYAASYSGLTARDMRKAYEVSAMVDGEAWGTPAIWSVEGHIKAARENPRTAPEELVLMNALLHYVDSVAASNAG